MYCTAPLWHPTAMCLILLWGCKNKKYKSNLFRSDIHPLPTASQRTQHCFSLQTKELCNCNCHMSHLPSSEPYDRKLKVFSSDSSPSGEDNLMWVGKGSWHLWRWHYFSWSRAGELSKLQKSHVNLESRRGSVHWWFHVLIVLNKVHSQQWRWMKSSTEAAGFYKPQLS